MKKRKLLLLAVAFVGMALFVSSCQKDEESTLPTSSSQSGEVEMTKSELLSKVADLKESELKNNSTSENNLIVGEYLDAIGKIVANDDGMEKVTLQTMLNMEEAVKNEVKVSLTKDKEGSSEKSSWTYVPYPISKSMSFNDDNTYNKQGRFYTTFTSGLVDVYILVYDVDEATRWAAMDYYRLIRYIFGQSLSLPQKKLYLELYGKNDVELDHRTYSITMPKGFYYTYIQFLTYSGWPGGIEIQHHVIDYRNQSLFFNDRKGGPIYRFGVHY